MSKLETSKDQIWVKIALMHSAAGWFSWSLVELFRKLSGMSAEESVTNYFSYVKNVLGVKTLQSARIRQSLQEAGTAAMSCDLLFLNLKQAQEPSVFSAESKELLEKMIQAMRLGDRRHLILECDLSGKMQSPAQILQDYLQKVKTPFVVLFSAKPISNQIQNIGAVKFIESFGPATLLQNPNAKKVAWNDLQKVMKEIGVL